MPPSYRNLKNQLKSALISPNYPAELLPLSSLPPLKLLNPLLSCLPLPEPTAQRAAQALALAVNTLATENLDLAKNFMRRLIWQMNEESGNIAWGVPQAFAAILCVNRQLALSYHKIYFSYIWDTGHDDNYCDHALLRQAYYPGITKILQAWPDLSAAALPSLVAAQTDPDPVCKALAHEALKEWGNSAI